MNWKHWLHGFVCALVGGFTTAITDVIIDPAKFNFHESGIGHVMEAALVSGVVSACFYLKQSPIPCYEEPPKVKPSVNP